MKTTKVTINGTDYNLDLNKAIADGYLTVLPKSRRLKVTDIPNGAIFRWIDEDGDVSTYLMVNNKMGSPGQCLSIDGGMPYKTWFDVNDESTQLSYFGIDSERWISEVYL